MDTGEQAFDENGDPDEEHRPKAINSLIRQILHSFTRKAYVGYTATPFEHIADASEELREEFDFMAQTGLTPEQYGLKVKSHEVLTVTSPIKMRNSETLSLSYSGTRPQTILFHRDAKIQEANLNAADSLVSSLGKPLAHDFSHQRNGVSQAWPNAGLWKNIEAEKILNFLSAYTTHPNATSAKAGVISDFITKMLEIGQLSTWNVALIGRGTGDGEPHSFGDIEITSLPTRKLDKPVADGDTKFSIGVLTGPRDESIDLDSAQWEKALELTRAAWKPDAARGRHKEDFPSDPSGKGIREARKVLGADAQRGFPSCDFPHRTNCRKAKASRLSR